MSPQEIFQVLELPNHIGKPKASKSSVNYKGNFDLTITTTNEPLTAPAAENEPELESETES